MYVAFISWMLEVLTIICKKKKKIVFLSSTVKKFSSPFFCDQVYIGFRFVFYTRLKFAILSTFFNTK